jgi:hypothetical protein
MKARLWGWVLGIAGASFVLWRVVRSYQGASSVTDIVKDSAVSVGARKMANGSSYADYAALVLNELYGSGAVLHPWFKNTDEEYLIRLLNKIDFSEYMEFNSVYQTLKKEKNGWFDGYNATASLVQDVKAALNAGELSRLVSLRDYF